MKNQKISNYIGSLINSGALQEAGSLLEKIFESSQEDKLKNQTLLLNARFTQLKQNERSGTYREAELSLERNKILAGYITLKDELLYLDTITYQFEQREIPEFLDTDSVLEYYRKRLRGSRFLFQDDITKEKMQQVLNTFEISIENDQLFYFYYDASYWFGKPLGLLLAGNRLQGRELLKKRQEVLISQIDENYIQLEDRWGIFFDLRINQSTFYSFDNLISQAEATIVKEFLHDMARLV